APLTYRGESLGVLVALSATPFSFMPRDVDVVQSFATQAAIAISNARLYEAQQELASRDPLTGLLNHREFHETVSRELERCRRYGGRLSVALFDLDGFKTVNDVSGHAAGDRVLRGAAERLEAACRGSDMAFRIGGDEFALLLPETSGPDAANVAARAARWIGEVSFGVAAWPEDGPSKDAFLARADENLYGMKRERSREHARLALASGLSARLAHLLEPESIVHATVEELCEAYDCELALILAVEDGGGLRPVAGRGPLLSRIPAFEDWSQSLDRGVTGRVARTGEPALIHDTRADPDFVGGPRQGDPCSELAVPIRVAGAVWGVLNLEATRNDAFTQEDLLLADTLAAQVGGALHRSRLFEELESTFVTTLGVLSDALETKDSYTAAHADDVADFAVRVGRRLDLSEEDLRTLRYGALLHDIGKIGVRSEVLNKPAALTAEEFEEMKQHTVIGARMLERIPF